MHVVACLTISLPISLLPFLARSHYILAAKMNPKSCTSQLYSNILQGAFFSSRKSTESSRVFTTLRVHSSFFFSLAVLLRLVHQQQHDSSVSSHVRPGSAILLPLCVVRSQMQQPLLSLRGGISRQAEEAQAGLFTDQRFLCEY